MSDVPSAEPREKSGSPAASSLGEIRAYTLAHRELQSAHHFTFDVPIPGPDGSCSFVIMGINPGETDADRARVAGPTEETREFDFHDRFGRSAASRRWHRTVRQMLPEGAVTLTELFFWSTRDTQQLRRQFGALSAQNPHVSFCTRINKQLFEKLRPDAIIVPGLGVSGLAAKLYDLRPGRTITSREGHRIVLEYEDCRGTPWIFAKHWSGGRFRRGERAEVFRQVRALAFDAQNSRRPRASLQSVAMSHSSSAA